MHLSPPQRYTSYTVQSASLSHHPVPTFRSLSSALSPPTAPSSPLWNRTPSGLSLQLNSASFQPRLVLPPATVSSLLHHLSSPTPAPLFLSSLPSLSSSLTLSFPALSTHLPPPSSVDSSALLPLLPRWSDPTPSEYQSLLDSLTSSLDDFHASPSLSHYLHFIGFLRRSPSPTPSPSADLRVECLAPALSLRLVPLPLSAVALQPSSVLLSLRSPSPIAQHGYLTLTAAHQLRLLHLPSDALRLPLLGVFTTAAPQSLAAYVQALHFLYAAGLTRLTVAPLTFLLLSFHSPSAPGLYEVTASIPEPALVHSTATVRVEGEGEGEVEVPLEPVSQAVLHRLWGTGEEGMAASTATTEGGIWSEREGELGRDGAMSPASLRSPSPLPVSPPRPHTRPIVRVEKVTGRGDSAWVAGDGDKENLHPTITRGGEGTGGAAGKGKAEEERKKRLRAVSFRMREDKRRQEMAAKNRAAAQEKAAQEAAAALHRARPRPRLTRSKKAKDTTTHGRAEEERKETREDERREGEAPISPVSPVVRMWREALVEPHASGQGDERRWSGWTTLAANARRSSGATKSTGA